jgi:hypothetical protein
MHMVDVGLAVVVNDSQLKALVVILAPTSFAISTDTTLESISLVSHSASWHVASWTCPKNS